MNRLFVDLYLDEDVDVLVAQLVKARGFSSLTCRDAGQLRVADAALLAYAVEQKKTLLTHNRADFEALHQQYLSAGRMHYGILIAVRRPPYQIVRNLLVILNRVTADEMENQIRYI